MLFFRKSSFRKNRNLTIRLQDQGINMVFLALHQDLLPWFLANGWNPHDLKKDSSKNRINHFFLRPDNHTSFLTCHQALQPLWLTLKMKKIDPEQIVFLGFALTLLLEFCSEKRWVMSKSNMYILISGHIPVQALTLIKVKNHALVSQVQTSLKHMKNHNIDLFFGSLLVN